MVTHQRDPLPPWGSPQHLRADGGHPSWPPVPGEGVSGLAGSAAQPTGRERAPPKSLWLSHPVSLMNGPAPQALSACKGQLQRLLQGVKPAAGGSAGGKSLFRVQLCRGKAKSAGACARGWRGLCRAWGERWQLSILPRALAPGVPSPGAPRLLRTGPAAALARRGGIWGDYAGGVTKEQTFPQTLQLPR